MGDITLNFSAYEFACKCNKCKGGSRISPDLIQRLQQMRTATGQSITITSGVRCRQHPESIKRPTSSQIPLNITSDDQQDGWDFARVETEENWTGKKWSSPAQDVYESLQAGAQGDGFKPYRDYEEEGKVGHAVDIATGSSQRRFVLLVAAIRAGFTRIGIGKTFLHLDNDISKAQGVVFDYYEQEKK